MILMIINKERMNDKNYRIHKLLPDTDIGKEHIELCETIYNWLDTMLRPTDWHKSTIGPSCISIKDVNHVTMLKLAFPTNIIDYYSYLKL